jgi:Tfp pilus assembly protein PilV
MINKFYTKGFTLVETLLAVLILTTAITGPLTVAYRSFIAAAVTREQITAFYLAQDAIEFIRFSKDSNTRAGTDWLTGSIVNLSACTGASGCSIDSVAGTVAAGASALKFNSTSNSYNTTGTGVVVYTRTTKLIQVSSTEYIASTTVTWPGTGNVARSVTLFENIFKWQ